MGLKPTQSSVSTANGCVLTVMITHSDCGVIHSGNCERQASKHEPASVGLGPVPSLDFVMAIRRLSDVGAV